MSRKIMFVSAFILMMGFAACGSDTATQPEGTTGTTGTEQPATGGTGVMESTTTAPGTQGTSTAPATAQ